PLVRSLVGQQRRPRYVTDRVYTLGAGAELLVHTDETLLGKLDSSRLEANPLYVRRAADRAEHALRLDHLRLTLGGLDRELRSLLADVGLLETRAGEDFHPPLAITLLHHRGT